MKSWFGPFNKDMVSLVTMDRVTTLGETEMNPPALTREDRNLCSLMHELISLCADVMCASGRYPKSSVFTICSLSMVARMHWVTIW